MPHPLMTLPKRRGRPRTPTGLYAPHFQTDELQALEGTPEGLGEEINLLRVLIRRVFAQADANAQTLDEWTAALAALGAASNRLAALLRAQAELGQAAGDVAGVLNAALAEVTKEIRP